MLTTPSRPGEFHPEPLTDPDVNLSIHPARATPEKAAAFRQDKEFLRLPVDSIPTWVTCPLRSAGVTLLPRYYETVRPCPADQYFRPRGVSACAFSLGTAGRFSSSVPEPGIESRHLCTGHHMASKQVSAMLVPGAEGPLRFRCRLLIRFDAFSVVHLRSSLYSSHDVIYSRLLTMTFTTAAFGRSSSWLFEACSYKPASKGLPSSSRRDMNRLYRQQTGREMSDYILVQQADKVVRYSQLPPEADVFRHALLNLRRSASSESDTGQPVALSAAPSEGDSELPVPFRVRLKVTTREPNPMDTPSRPSGPAPVESYGSRANVQTMVKKKDALLGTDPHLFESRDSNVLLSTNELANLTGFKPKTIRRWVSRKLLNYIRVGNRFRFRPAAVKLFLAQREVRK